MRSEQPAAVSCFDQPGQMSVHQGRQALLEAVAGALPPKTVMQPVCSLTGYVLAEDIRSPVNVPAQTNAAMDGYALALPEASSSGDSETHRYPDRYILMGRALAGHGYEGDLQPGQAVTITTGAPVPAGANTVVMREICHEADGAVVIEKPASLRPDDNIRQAGEDLALNQIAVTAGTRLTPAHQGLIASLGLTEVPVFQPLSVAVFSTGDEVVPQGEPLPPHSIYDTNRYSLMALLQRLNCRVIDLGILPDQEDTLADTLAQAAVDADVVISSGGVSVGVADYIKSALNRVGEIGFWRMNIRPGRPFAFGRIGHNAADTGQGAWFFGLPGNPVAVMVTFMQLAQPALRHLQGEREWQLNAFPARASENMRSRAGRTDFHRGIWGVSADGTLEVRTTGTQGSGILRSMTEANCLIEIGDDAAGVTAGETVMIYPFSDLL